MEIFGTFWENIFDVNMVKAKWSVEVESTLTKRLRKNVMEHFDTLNVELVRKRLPFLSTYSL